MNGLHFTQCWIAESILFLDAKINVYCIIPETFSDKKGY
jgi:hypothetical protein